MIKKINSFVAFLIPILLCLSFFIIIKPVVISGSAMTPSYKNGERYLANKLTYITSVPKRGDVVVYRFPQNQRFLFIGRIIGLPGERLTIQDGKVTINGNLLTEDYLTKGTITETMEKREFRDIDEFQGKLEKAGGPKTLEEGQKIILPVKSYFIMGDNRSGSIDSRSLGFVKREEILGKLSFKY